jgi:hypothetical protein
MGAAAGELVFSADRDTVNHVLAEKEVCAASVKVPVRSLDDVLDGRVPALIKIDVEGFETEIIQGATKTLTNRHLIAVIMELNGSGTRYGYDENELHRRMLDFGFQTYRYDPERRSCHSMNMQRMFSGNTLYARSMDARLKNLIEKNINH